MRGTKAGKAESEGVRGTAARKVGSEGNDGVKGGE